MIPSRKRRNYPDPNWGVTVGLGESPQKSNGATTRAGDPVTRISRLAAFYDSRDAMQNISEVGRSGALRDSEANMVLNPPAIVDPPAVNDDHRGLKTTVYGDDATLGTVDAPAINTVAGRRQAAEALNLPSVPKSRRKYKQQKARGRG